MSCHQKFLKLASSWRGTIFLQGKLPAVSIKTQQVSKLTDVLRISQVKELVSDVDNHEVKFKSGSAGLLCVNLVVFKTPAQPSVWQLHLDEPAATQDATDVRCGEPFQLLVEAHDRFGNR